MQKIKAIVLISLLGFLGCSDSDNASRTHLSAPVPINPYGPKCTKALTYVWTAVSGATEYYLWVQDKNDTDIFKIRYSAEEAGCASDEATCTVTTGIESIMQAVWSVQACTEDVCGEWSERLDFAVMCLYDPTPRFVDNGDGTVTDNLSDLMWAQTLSLSNSTTDYGDAYDVCSSLTLAGFTDWRLPTLGDFTRLTTDYSNIDDLFLYRYLDPAFSWHCDLHEYPCTYWLPRGVYYWSNKYVAAVVDFSEEITSYYQVSPYEHAGIIPVRDSFWHQYRVLDLD